MKKIVILTGAGMSAESGLATFRDSDGLWEGHDVQEVASPEGFKENPSLVLDFYNQRRKNLLEAKPNKGHFGLVKLEKQYDVQIVTQNVDDLHERAGNSNVLHLHGELRKAESTKHKNLIYDWEKDLNLGDLCEKGFQLRPHIVWFGEMVPKIDEAVKIVKQADLLIVIGTSLQVYPAAGLMQEAPMDCKTVYIDPNPAIENGNNLTVIKKGVSEGLKGLDLAKYF